MENKIDIFDVGTIAAFVAASLGDFAFLACIGMFIPAVGLVFLGAFLFAHYLAAGLVGIFFFHKTRGWLAKGILLAALILPLPLLTIGIVLGIALSNKFIAFLGKQVLIQGIALATAGAGEALEGAELAEVGAEAAEATTEAAGTLAEGTEAAAESGSAGAETGGVGGEGTGGGEAGEAGQGAKTPEEINRQKEIEKELGGESEQEPMELLEEKTFGETPEEPGKTPEAEEPQESHKDRVEKIRDIVDRLDRTSQPQQNEKQGKDQEEEEEPLQDAA